MSDRHHTDNITSMKWEDHFNEVGKLSEKEGTTERTTRMFTSRRNRGCGQSVFVALVLVTLVYGCYLYFDLKKSLEETRDRAVRYQQQQESLTGQLQVVYEHRTRLEKGLQESKSEVKRVKEESQRKLELEQQEASNKYNALNIQHKMLKSQNEDIKEELNGVRQRERKATEEKERVAFELESNITRLKEDCEAKKKYLHDQVEALKTENDQGQEHLERLQQTNQQLDQEKSLLTARLIENEQLISASEKEKAFLQNQVDTFSRQVQSLKLQLEQANLPKVIAPNIPQNNPQNIPQGNQIPGAQKVLDPYEQQRIAFDKQRQQDLLEQRYGQQAIVNPAGNQVDGRFAQPQQPQQPVIMRQVPQQGPVVLQQHQQQPVPQDNVAVPQQPEAKELDRNVNLHIDQGNGVKKPDGAGGDDSDYDDSAAGQQGVRLRDPEVVAKEDRQHQWRAAHYEQLQLIRERQERIERLRQKYQVMADAGGNKEQEEEGRLPDAKKPDEEEGESKKEQDEEEKDEDEKPLWQRGDDDDEGVQDKEDEDDEINEDENMQALQEKQLDEAMRQQEKAEEDENIALHPPGNYQENEERNGDEDAPGLVVDVQRDEVEEHIEEEQEDLRKQQQLQLQARAHQADEKEDKDEDSNYDNKDDSISDNNQVGLQSKFVVKAKKGKNVGENPDEDEDERHRGLDRPEINDAPMNDAINNPPVLDHPAKESEEKEDNPDQHNRFNQEMR